MKLAMWLKIAAEIPIGLLAASSLFIGIGQMIARDSNGFWLLCGAVFFGAMMWLAWWRPRYMSVMLMLFSMMLWAIFRGIVDSNGPDDRVGAIIIALPMSLSGFLLLFSWWRASRARE